MASFPDDSHSSVLGRLSERQSKAIPEHIKSTEVLSKEALFVAYAPLKPRLRVVAHRKTVRGRVSGRDYS